MNLLLANIRGDTGSDQSLASMKHLHFPMGLAIIAGHIRKHRPHHRVFVVDGYLDELGDQDVFGVIGDRDVDCVLMSGFLGNFQYGFAKRFITAFFNGFPAKRFILGGPMASTVPELLLANTAAPEERFICVIGEGEATAIELLDTIEAGGDLSTVAGICYRHADEVIRTVQRPRLVDIDQSVPDYWLLDTKRYAAYVKKNGRCWEIIASRGCYGSCVYCKLTFGKKLTYRSPASLLAEMEWVFHEYGIDAFNFVDDNFLNSDAQVWAFCDALRKSRYRFRWRFQGRADRFSPEIAEALAAVGLFDVSFGIESGSPRILDEMNKKLDLDKAMKNIRAIPPTLDTHATFIVGMPSESELSIAETERFIGNSGLRHVSAGILTLFPGTVLYENARRQGRIPDEDAYCESLGPVYTQPYVNLTRYPDDQLIAWAQRLNRLDRG